MVKKNGNLNVLTGNKISEEQKFCLLSIIMCLNMHYMKWVTFLS